MIKLKEIINRKYVGSELVAFEYVLKDLEGLYGEKRELRIWFDKLKQEENGVVLEKPIYRIQTIINRNLYDFVYELPKNGMPLEKIVAIGLNAMKLNLYEEAKKKEMIAYTIGDLVKDM